MSIRNRVMLATLGLAALAFVVTLQAQEDKILIVRDGSVEVFVNNSHFRPKENGKQKWSKGADSVQVFEDTNLAACSTAVQNPPSTDEEFDHVLLKIVDRDNNNQIVDIPVGHEGNIFTGGRKLYLEPPTDWRFEFKKYGHRLVFGNQRPNPNVKIQQVVVTKDGNQKTYPSAPSTGTLCVVFRN